MKTPMMLVDKIDGTILAFGFREFESSESVYAVESPVYQLPSLEPRQCIYNKETNTVSLRTSKETESNAKKIAELKEYIYNNWLDSTKTQDEIKKEFKKLNNELSNSVDGDIEKFKKWMEE